MTVLIEHSDQLAKRIVAVFDLSRIRKMLAHHATECVTIKRLAPSLPIRVLHRQSMTAVLDVQQTEPFLTVKALHADQLAVLIVGVTGLSPVRSHHRGKTVETVIFPANHLLEHIHFSRHQTKPVVAQITPGAAIRNPLRLIRIVVMNRS